MVDGGQLVADIGIVGAGQLARMMVQAAIPLGIRVRVLAAHAAESAALVWPDIVIGSPDDPAALLALGSGCRVVTFDHELVPPAALDRLIGAGMTLHPAPSSLVFAQDKHCQRSDLGARGFPVPPHGAVTTADDLSSFAGTHGWPVVVKTPRGGYDGRGVWVVETPAQAAALLPHLTTEGRVALVEAFVPIEREMAIMVARRPSGETAVYPMVETVQIDGICREVIAPARVAPEIERAAERLACAVAEQVGLTGVMAVELFLVGGTLVINELAMRPHNSGHFTIEGAVTSQFEQHLRAVLDWPLGSTRLTAPVAVMVNVLGNAQGADPAAALPGALAIPGAHIHLYGKEPRPGRKLGHVTVTGSDLAAVRAAALDAAARLGDDYAETQR